MLVKALNKNDVRRRRTKILRTVKQHRWREEDHVEFIAFAIHFDLGIGGITKELIY